MMTGEKHRKTSVRDFLVKAVRPVISSHVVPYLRMISVHTASQGERTKEKKKSWEGGGIVLGISQKEKCMGVMM